MSSAYFISPLAEAYARHVESPVSAAELKSQLERRLAFFPLWMRLYFATSAVFVRFLGPGLVLGRWKAFEALEEAEAEECLGRLQRDGRMHIKAPFLGIKSLLLACCYGSPEFLKTIGYRAGAKVHA